MYKHELWKEIQVGVLAIAAPAAALILIGAFICGMIWLFTSVTKIEAGDMPKDSRECKCRCCEH